MANGNLPNRQLICVTIYVFVILFNNRDEYTNTQRKLQSYTARKDP